jgi:murein L,D-transpeptidase YcbB/YkuD
MLKNRPEVYLLYLTAWVDEKSVLNFRRDIYERDKRLIDALASKPVYDIAQ